MMVKDETELFEGNESRLLIYMIISLNLHKSVLFL